MTGLAVAKFLVACVPAVIVREILDLETALHPRGCWLIGALVGYIVFMAI